MITRGRVLAAILIASAAGFLTFVFSLNNLIDKNRDAIREEIQQYLGRAVGFDELRLNLRGGLGLSATGLRIAEDTRFAATPIVQARELKMLVRWFPILQGKIEISSLVLDAPEIQIIRNEAGMLNTSALKIIRKVESPGVSAPERRQKPKFSISAVQVTNGKVDFIDRSAKEPVEIQARNVRLSLSGLSSARESNLKFSAGLFEGPGQRLVVEGKVGPFQKNLDWTEHPVDVHVRLDSLLLPQLTRAVPPLRNRFPLYIGMRGAVTAQARVSGTVAQPRISELALSGSLFDSAAENVAFAGELDLSKSRLWSDGQVKGKITIDGLNLAELREIPFLKQALPADLIMEGPLKLAGEIEGRLDDWRMNSRINAEENTIQLGTWLKKPKGTPAQLDLRLGRQKNRVVVEESILAVRKTKIKFSGVVEAAPDPHLLVRVRSDATDLSGWATLLPSLAGYRVGGMIRLDLSILKRFGLREKDLEIRGALRVDNSQAKERGSGRGIEGITARIFFTGKEARAEDLSFRLGGSDLNVEARMPDLAQNKLQYSLRSSRLNLADLNGLVGQKSDELKTLTSTGEVEITSGKPVLRGNLFSSEGVLQEIPYRNLKGEIVWSEGRVSFKNVSLQALSGTLRANGAWQLDAKAQRVSLDSSIDAVDLKEFLSQRFPSFKDHIEGTLHLTSRLRGEGSGSAELRENIKGEGAAQIRGGSLKNFNLPERLVSGLSRLPGTTKLPVSRSPRFISLLERSDTPFDVLAASFILEQGRVRTRNLSLSTPEYSISGEGWIGMDQTMKLNGWLFTSPQLTQDLVHENGNLRYLMDRHGKLAIPFRLEGSFSHLQLKPDLQGLLSAMQRGFRQLVPKRNLRDRQEQRRKAD
ncbi:MAG: AsmA family protein [Deltaproteobacteria bacterium]|nr:AsmA family protein [Deltaproteobacteria bacterium]